MQAGMQATLVEFVQLLEESVGKCRLHYDGMFQEERRHHRDVCQRQDQGADDAEHQGFGHWSEVFSFDSVQSQYREEHDENNQYGECSRADYTGSTFFHLFVHLFAGQCPSAELLAVDVCQDTFQYDNGTIYHNTEVDGAEAHQIGGYVEKTHHDECEKHSQRDDRSYNQPGTDVAQKDNKYEEDDDGSFNKVVDDGGDVPVDQFRTVQIRFDADAFGQ